MKKLRVIIYIVVSFIAAYALFGFFILPPILSSILAKDLGEVLKREVIVGKVKANPFKLTLDVKEFTIKEKDEAEVFFSLQGLHLNLSSMSLFKFGLVLEELILTGPYMRIEHLKDGSFNFSDIASQTERKDEKEVRGRPPRFSLANIQLAGGAVEFLERTKGKTHRLAGISLTIPFISNFPYHSKVKVSPSFTASIDGASVGMQGGSLPFAETKETLLELDLEALDVTKYLAYAPIPTDLKVEKAFLDLKAIVSYETRADTGHRVTARGKITLRDLNVLDATKESIFSLPLLAASVAESDITGGILHVESIVLKSPSLQVVREQDGGLNLTRLFPKSSSTQKDAERLEVNADSGKGPPKILVDKLSIEDGAASFKDTTVAGGFKTEISGLTVLLSGFSNRPGALARLEVSFKTEKGTSLKSSGNLSLDPLSVNGHISLGPLRASDYNYYLDKALLFEIVSCSLNIDGDYEVKTSNKSLNMALSGLRFEIKDTSLKLKGEERPFFEAPFIGLEGGFMDLASRKMGASAFFMREGRCHFIRDSAGVLNYLKIFPDTGPKEAEQPARQRGEWFFGLKKALVEVVRVDFEDLSPHSPVKLPLKDLRVEAEDISNEREAKGTLAMSLTLGEKGKASVKGVFSINPFAAVLGVDLAGIQIRGFQGYWLPHLNLAASNGIFHLNGSVELGIGQRDEIGLRIKANAGIKELSLLENGKARELISWRSLDIKKVDLSLKPFSLSVDGISLVEPFFTIVVDRDGRMNLMKIVVETDSPKKKDEKGGPLPRLRLGNFDMKKARISFRDESISPLYSITLSAISMGLKGLTTEGFKAADFFFGGNFDGHAPLEAKGRLNPLSQDIFADLKLSLKDFPLSPLTPYSGKYIGQTVEKGNLSLDLKYIIDKRRIEAHNKLLLDQFTLGHTIPSPQATSLPVSLAVALLKNRNGVIELDLPITGRLDDPQFSIGGIVLKMIINILEKAITSPFSILGAIFGAGEELSHFDFEPGSSLVKEGSTQGLDKLIDALAERPELKLDILGYVDEKKDSEALKDMRLTSELKSVKIRDLTARGLPVPPLDRLSIGEKERALYIARLFKEREAKGPNVDKSNEITVEQMEKELLEKLVISNDELRLLAMERTNAVKNYILASGKIQPERIFVMEPSSLSPDKREGIPDSRVDFRLK